MSSLRRHQSCFDGFGVPHFTYKYDVGILTQGAAKGLCKRTRIHLDFTLRHKRHFVAVQEFYWIFNGDNVTTSRRINPLDHRCQRCRLTRTRRTGYQDQTAPFICDLVDDNGQTKFGRIPRLVGNNAQNDTYSAALLKDIGAKSSDSTDAVAN